MPTHNSFKQLEKVTKLYLSNGEVESRREDTPSKYAEAIIWLASSGKRFNRAFVSAGLAESFSRMGLNVTLIEASPRLPNIGYYFSLEPEDYLLGTIDENHFFVGYWSDSLQYAFGHDISLFFRCVDRFVPQGFPHLVFLSFPIPSGNTEQGFIFDLRRLSRSLLSHGGDGTLGIPDLIFVAGENEEDETCGVFIDNVRKTFQEPLIHQAVLSSGVDGMVASDRSIHLSSEIFFGSQRRVPPRLREFDEMATGILELISTRRKRERRERARS